ncbi:MAG: hypothetical protein GX587_15465 [Bacteroidales bacterium]|nr:hypothetical protein [Bacteroidales bacterium]
MKNVSLRLGLALLVFAIACTRTTPEEKFINNGTEAIKTYLTKNMDGGVRLDSLVFIKADTITDKDIAGYAKNILYDQANHKSELATLKVKQFEIYFEMMDRREDVMTKTYREEAQQELDSVKLLYSLIDKVDSLIANNLIDSINVKGYLFWNKVRVVMPDLTVEEQELPFFLTTDFKIQEDIVEKFIAKMNTI